MTADTLAATSPAAATPHTYPDGWRVWETRAKLAPLEEVRAADYTLSPSQFVAHRPLADILADLAEARAEREQADAVLAEGLAKLGLEW